MTALIDAWLAADEWVGLVLGLVVVVLLIRQNMWAWPLGVAYVLASVTVLVEARLYANLALHLVGFLPLNLYGWYYWIAGKDDDAELPVTFAGTKVIVALVGLGAVVTVVLGWYFATNTDAAWPYWDNAVFAASLAAMWLTARKKIDNWVVWFFVNIVSVALYLAQDIPLYALLYAVYIALAIIGYREWRRSMPIADETRVDAAEPHG